MCERLRYSHPLAPPYFSAAVAALQPRAAAPRARAMPPVNQPVVEVLAQAVLKPASWTREAAQATAVPVRARAVIRMLPRHALTTQRAGAKPIKAATRQNSRFAMGHSIHHSLIAIKP